jgi:hypothetical protein
MRMKDFKKQKPKDETKDNKTDQANNIENKATEDDQEERETELKIGEVWNYFLHFI